MRAVVQRVTRACVSVNGEVVGQIAHGIVVLLGVAKDDTADDAASLAQKIASLRIFDDAQQKMNLSAGDVGGAALVVSQFTLLGDCRRGRRPSYDSAAPGPVALPLYLEFVERLREQGLTVALGRFQQQMLVELVNDGPATLLVDSRKAF